MSLRLNAASSKTPPSPPDARQREIVVMLGQMVNFWTPEGLWALFQRNPVPEGLAQSTAAFIADKPRLWSAAFLATRPRQRFFDVHPDGDRIAAAPTLQNAPPQDKVVFVLNFFEQLRQLASAK